MVGDDDVGPGAAEGPEPLAPEDADVWNARGVALEVTGRLKEATEAYEKALGDFIEANWPDYKPATVTSWTPALTVNGRAVAQADPTAWTRGVGGTAKMVYGYYVTDTVGGPLIWAEVRPQGPLRMQFPSDQVMILPQLTLWADSA